MLHSRSRVVASFSLDVLEHIPYARFTRNTLDVLCSYER
jgi:hypothetical protein